MKNDRLPPLEQLPRTNKKLNASPDRLTGKDELLFDFPAGGKSNQQLIDEVAERIVEVFGTNNAATARRLGTVSATIKAYTDRRRLPATEILIRMHEASGVSLNWLLLGKGEKFI